MFRFDEITGVWLDCDTQANDFDRCLFHQAVDDDMDFDQQGIISKKGAVRIYSTPQHQWGQRCLSIRIRTSSKITLSVIGSFSEATSPNFLNQTYLEETIEPNDEKIVNFLVMVFMIFIKNVYIATVYLY